MKERADTNQRLSVKDFENPLFDRQKVRLRVISQPGKKKERVIEGTTYTDNFNFVGFTYSLRNGSISIVNKDNEVLFDGFIDSSEEYEKALKKADRKQRRLFDKKGPQ